jgi:DNA modification methylase
MKKIELFSENGDSRGYYDIANQINDLTGKEWVFSTKSVIPKGYPPSYQQKLRNKHGGQKPPELCESLIRTFTKEGDRVLDPFCGVGGTLGVV